MDERTRANRAPQHFVAPTLSKAGQDYASVPTSRPGRQAILQDGAPGARSSWLGHSIVTGVPTGIKRPRRRMSALRMLMQPCAGRPAISCGWLVPWMPTTPPPASRSVGPTWRWSRTRAGRKGQRAPDRQAVDHVEAAAPSPIETRAVDPYPVNFGLIVAGRARRNTPERAMFAQAALPITVLTATLWAP